MATDFTSRIKQTLKSTKHVFKLEDAIEKSEGRCTPLDNVFIEHFKFISSNPLRENDYYKYLNSYKSGKKLNEKYFKHDLELLDRKSTRLNSSHVRISYAVFCLKKKKIKIVINKIIL